MTHPELRPKTDQSFQKGDILSMKGDRTRTLIVTHPGNSAVFTGTLLTIGATGEKSYGPGTNMDGWSVDRWEHHTPVDGSLVRDGKKMEVVPKFKPLKGDLVLCKTSDLVLLVTGEGGDTVFPAVVVRPGMNFELGRHSTTWTTSSFRPFTGSVTLAQPVALAA